MSGTNELAGSTVLITGAAGFIGSALAEKLLASVPGVRIVGLDNMNDYYTPSLKQWRVKRCTALAEKTPGASYTMERGSVEEGDRLARLMREAWPDYVIHLAAQAGVRNSIVHPDDYISSNVLATYKVLECCRHFNEDGGKLRHLLFASSSSVYGDSRKLPYEADDPTDKPVSFYAATKKACELMAYSYASLYRIPTTGLRFFTVYGPGGRPDMAYYTFTERFRRGDAVPLFNDGACRRDFTYIGDIVEGLMRVMAVPPDPEKHDGVPYAIYNIGCQNPVPVTEFVSVLAEELKRAGVLPEDFDTAGHIRNLPMQPGDVQDTYADCGPLLRDFGFAPNTELRDGLRAFAEWYREYTKGDE